MPTAQPNPTVSAYLVLVAQAQENLAAAIDLASSNYEAAVAQAQANYQAALTAAAASP